MKLEELLKKFAGNVGNKAGHEFWGVKDPELVREVEEQYQECIRRGVSKSIMDEILNAADYTEAEDGGASSKAIAVHIDALIAKALEEAA